jgi:large subunit ribosomal protein L32e
MTAEKKSTAKKETDLLKAHKALAEKKKAAVHATAKKVEAKKPATEHKAEAKAEAKAEVKKAEVNKPEAPVAKPKAEAAKVETPKPEVVQEEKAEKKTPAKKPEPVVAKKEKKIKKEKPIEKIEFLATEIKEVVGRKKKPSFIRQEYYKLPRLKLVWRKPRGIDSKQHEGKKGKGAKPDVGYGTPESIRGMHGAGYFPIIVNNVKDVSKVDTKTQAAVIAAAVGRNKRNEIIKAANKLKVIILNPRKGESK